MQCGDLHGVVGTRIVHHMWFGPIRVLRGGNELCFVRRWVLLGKLWRVKLCELRGRGIRRGRRRDEFECGVCFLVRRGQVFGRGGELVRELHCWVLPTSYRPGIVLSLLCGKVWGCVG